MMGKKDGGKEEKGFSGILHDRDIREPLFDYLENHYRKVRILEEKVIGKSRADLMMITNDGIFGIEIKSDADTYARLQRQVRDYDRFFDYNLVVVGTTHVMHIEEHVPAEWGIITVEAVNGEPDFYFLRRPKRNPRVEKKLQLFFLWRPELNRLLAENRLPRYEGKSKRFLCEKLYASVLEEELSVQIVEALFERDYTILLEEIVRYREEHIQKRRLGVRGTKGRKRRKLR